VTPVRGSRRRVAARWAECSARAARSDRSAGRRSAARWASGFRSDALLGESTRRGRRRLVSIELREAPQEVELVRETASEQAPRWCPQVEQGCQQDCQANRTTKHTYRPRAVTGRRNGRRFHAVSYNSTLTSEEIARGNLELLWGIFDFSGFQGDRNVQSVLIPKYFYLDARPPPRYY